MVRLLHVLGVIVWVGGMFFAHFALRPALPGLPPPLRLPLLAAVLRRFMVLAGVAMVAVIASGVALIASVGGMPAVGRAVHAMAGIGVVMAVVYAWIVAAPLRRLLAAVTAADWPVAAAAAGRIRAAVALNLALGLLATILGVLASA